MATIPLFVVEEGGHPAEESVMKMEGGALEGHVYRALGRKPIKAWSSVHKWKSLKLVRHFFLLCLSFLSGDF